MLQTNINPSNNLLTNAEPNVYDYIIVGAGCAGLSLAVRLIESGKFLDKKILICDRQHKNLNDRTWCFWEQHNGYFESIVYHSWDKLSIKHPIDTIQLQMAPYKYKLIRGIDFYAYCFNIINQAPNCTIRYGEVADIDAAKGTLSIANESYKAEIVFSSVALQKPHLQKGQFYLLQHFRGWWIETDVDTFNPAEADLMNFNTSQQHGCAFVYVLPTSKRSALVEYTLFTEQELNDEQYNDGLNTFISQQLNLNNYRITEVEHGIIPMTNMQFPKAQGKVVFIGAASGQTKASTGYTFQFIQKQAAAMVSALIKTAKPTKEAPAKRFQFYDSVLLRVLHERKLPGDVLFYQMFLKNKAPNVFRFLDNETSFTQELQIMNATQKMIFVPAAIKELL